MILFLIIKHKNKYIMWTTKVQIVTEDGDENDIDCKELVGLSHGDLVYYKDIRFIVKNIIFNLDHKIKVVVIVEE